MGGRHTGAPLIHQCEQKCDRPDQNINFAPNYFELLLGGGAASQTSSPSCTRQGADFEGGRREESLGGVRIHEWQHDCAEDRLANDLSSTVGFWMHLSATRILTDY